MQLILWERKRRGWGSGGVGVEGDSLSIQHALEPGDQSIDYIVTQLAEQHSVQEARCGRMDRRTEIGSRRVGVQRGGAGEELQMGGRGGTWQAGCPGLDHSEELNLRGQQMPCPRPWKMIRCVHSTGRNPS